MGLLAVLDRGYALLIGLLVWLGTFNTNITHLSDALAQFGEYGAFVTWPTEQRRVKA
jgi:hypothetical protein